MESSSPARSILDPYATCFDVPVRGGELRVARSGPPPGQARAVVLAAHGVTASLMTWLTVARLLDDDVCLLAPDLRGRGRSAALPGPYGMATHVVDLLAVLDHAGVDSAVLLGHSMGAYLGARLAAEHPERATALVLIDAGLPLAPPDDLERAVETAVASAITRLTTTFPSAEHYVDGWHTHPAFARVWSDDVEAYARYDVVETERGARCAASMDAVRIDTEEMVRDDATRTALERVHCPVELLRAERGLFGDADDPLIATDELRAFAASHPWVHVEAVSDVNHYTIVMGGGPGAPHVAAAVAAAVSNGRRPTVNPGPRL
jgi:lipase